MPLKLKNAAAGPLSAAEQLSPGALRERITSCTDNGGALLSLFALELDGKINLCALLGDRKEHTVEILLSPLESDEYPSVTVTAPQAHYFEREIAEQFDILPKGHPWLKPVRFHAPYRKGADVLGGKRPLPGVCDYFKMSGSEIHEVAVGPVHAGIIEPGHFRFQCHGENVYHLEIQLGYQHRGVENAMTENPARRLYLAETLAGDTTIAHSTAYCRVAEALCGATPDPRADALRSIALELERLANHTGDMGALAGDTGYLPTMSFCGRLRGDYLNMTALICGSRFGRGLNTEGGVRFELNPDLKTELLRRLDEVGKDTAGAIGLLWEAPSVLARFEETGALTPATAISFGLVGVAARACGLNIDSRNDFPSGHYRLRATETALGKTGDVYARAMVRWREIQRSIEHIRAIADTAAGRAVKPAACGKMAANSVAVCIEEGWRGELVHAAFTNANGKISRYKITDPSFKNWAGLGMALRGQQISDFPLCNKSFNLSYCGTDL